jgi:DNA-binding transcriptional LysR family regulator
MMLSDQMRYFAAAARHEHLGRAADELDMSQPALSRSILKLEEELGVQLFDRAGRGVRLNAAGKILLRRIELARAECDDALRELREQRNLSRKTVSIGYFATFGVRLIPELVKSFCAIEPSVQFQLFEGPSPILAEQLLAGEIDLCMASQFAHAAVSWQPVFSEELFALVPPNHRLAKNASIDLADLAQEPFVALKVGHSLRQTLEDLCREAGFTPQITLEGYEVATLRGLVGAGFGVTLSPKRSVAAPIQAVSIRVRQPHCQRMIGLSWRKGRWLSPKTLLFKDHLLKNLSAARAKLEHP